MVLCERCTRIISNKRPNSDLYASVDAANDSSQPVTVLRIKPIKDTVTGNFTVHIPASTFTLNENGELVSTTQTQVE